MGVEVVGRGLYYVDSHSRDDLRFLVDMEPVTFYDFQTGLEVTESATCTCEDYELRKSRPCKHIHETGRWLVFRMGLEEEDEQRVLHRVRTTIESAFK